MQRISTFLLVVAVGGFPAVAHGDLSTHPLLDPSDGAMAGGVPAAAHGALSAHPLLDPFNGAIVRDSSQFTPTIGAIDVIVDYAVWSPGTFTATLDLELLALTFNPATQYVYAYQLHNQDPSRALSSFGLDSAGGVLTGSAQDLGFDSATSDQAAFFGLITPGTPDTAEYFFDPAIFIGGYSGVLLLSSPGAPGLSVGGVTDSGEAAFGTVAAPIPAPGAILLGLIGLAIVGRLRT